MIVELGGEVVVVEEVDEVGGFGIGGEVEEV